MSDALGLSIGVANLVAARPGSTPLARSSAVTLFDDRPTEIGLPDDTAGPPPNGLLLRGFVERVGDPEPVVAPDGSRYRGEQLTAEALEAMARTVGYGSPVSIAVPGHWPLGRCAALREALSAKRDLATSGGVPPVLISDATAALAALCVQPAFPTEGVVALCDFGASGTSVTLADAASNYQQIGPTVRDTEFSGDNIDQLMLRNLQARAADSADADLTGTNPMGSLSRRFDECRRAKEQLSSATMTVVPAEMPGFGQDVRLSRTDFEKMISGPLDRFVASVEEILQRHKVPPANLAAAATVGGGACIPLITARLSERLRVPVFTTAQPAFSAAIGAAVLGQQRSSSSGRTAAGPVADAPAELGDRQQTHVSPAAWAIQAANEAAGESAADDDEHATYRALAWSQDAQPDVEPLSYPVDPVDPVGVPEAEPEEPERFVVEPERLRWYARPAMLMSVSAAAALILVGIVVAVAYKLTISNPATRVPADTPAPPPQSSAVTTLESQLRPPATAPPPTTTAAPNPPPATTTVAPSTTWATTRSTTTTRPSTSTTRTTPSTTPSATATTPPSTTWTTPGAGTNRSYPPETSQWPETTTPPILLVPPQSGY